MSVAQAHVEQTVDQQKVWIVFSGFMRGMLIASLDQILVSTAMPRKIVDV